MALHQYIHIITMETMFSDLKVLVGHGFYGNRIHMILAQLKEMH